MSTIVSLWFQCTRLSSVITTLATEVNTLLGHVHRGRHDTAGGEHEATDGAGDAPIRPRPVDLAGPLAVLRGVGKGDLGHVELGGMCDGSLGEAELLVLVDDVVLVDLVGGVVVLELEDPDVGRARLLDLDQLEQKFYKEPEKKLERNLIIKSLLPVIDVFRASE